MVDQNSQFYAILTNVGAAKQANADALGIPWVLTHMGIGDANPTGLESPALPMPDGSWTSLLNEWRRAPLNQLKVDDKDSAIIIAEQVIPAEVGGRWIREIALYDADGDLVAVANCPPTYKPMLSQGSGRTQVVRMNLVVSSSSNIQLKIDPSVVLATRAYVDALTVRAGQAEAEAGTENSKIMTRYGCFKPSLKWLNRRRRARLAGQRWRPKHRSQPVRMTRRSSRRRSFVPRKQPRSKLKQALTTPSR